MKKEYQYTVAGQIPPGSVYTVIGKKTKKIESFVSWNSAQELSCDSKVDFSYLVVIGHGNFDRRIFTVGDSCKQISIDQLKDMLFQLQKKYQFKTVRLQICGIDNYRRPSCPRTVLGEMRNELSEKCSITGPAGYSIILKGGIYLDFDASSLSVKSFFKSTAIINYEQNLTKSLQENKKQNSKNKNNGSIVRKTNKNPPQRKIYRGGRG